MEARHLHGFVLQVFIVMQFRQNWTRDNDTQLIHAETTGGAGPSQPGGGGQPKHAVINNKLQATTQVPN